MLLLYLIINIIIFTVYEATCWASVLLVEVAKYVNRKLQRRCMSTEVGGKQWLTRLFNEFCLARNCYYIRTIIDASNVTIKREDLMRMSTEPRLNFMELYCTTTSAA
jgi:hypothetical protein